MSVSSTNGRNKIDQDAYMTPPSAANALSGVMDHSMMGVFNFLEPCRGGGQIYNRFNFDRKMHAELSEGIDYLLTEFYGVDVIITNPPFSLAMEFLEKSLTEAATVIYLLRLNFLGSQRRKAFWQGNRPSHVLTLAERPCFAHVCKSTHCKARYSWDVAPTECPVCGGRVRPQTDSTEYAWFCWDNLGIINLERGVHVL